MRQAHIFYKDQLAGILTENDAGYEFCYLPEYLSLEKAKAVSMTLPLQEEAYTSPVLFPFFDGLIPEGWLLDVALRNTDISILDRMALLLTCCKDCIGAVSVFLWKKRREAMCNCLYCYRPLLKGEKDMHTACIKKFFGTTTLPVLDYTTEQLDQLALQIIQDQTSLTGVQPKLSLHLNEHEGSKRLTIVGLWGGYICKPQTSQYEMMPEVEDLTMHLAEVARIEVVPHTLMRMADDTLCYLTRRIDRTSAGEKIAMEDMCQLTERQTEHKYKSSYERIGKAVLKYSSLPKMDVTNFFELVLFSWLTGNNDMHLKNFSLYEVADMIRLTPAYDLLNAAIINPKDDEELALTLNGRKKKLQREDFIRSAATLGIENVIVERLINKYIKLLPKFETVIQSSFLSDELKEKYGELLKERLARLSQKL